MSTPDPATRTRVIATIADILEIDPATIAGDLRLREDLGMDSLGSLELLSTISEELRLDLEMEDAMEIVTVADACAFVERHRENGAGGLSADIP
jgi:acyl carrier protein